MGVAFGGVDGARRGGEQGVWNEGGGGEGRDGRAGRRCCHFDH